MTRARSGAISSPTGVPTPPTGHSVWHSAFPLPSPTTHIVYSPFSVSEAQGARLLGTSWEHKQKFEVRRHGDSPQPLAGLHPGTAIYVVCHCNAGLTYVADNCNNTLDAPKLAERIQNDGLDTRHRILKLWACSGGAYGANGSAPSFGKQLKQEMTRLGYTNLTLYAYTATLYSLPTDYDPAFGAASNPAGPHKTAAGIGGKVRAKTTRIVVT